MPHFVLLSRSENYFKLRHEIIIDMKKTGFNDSFVGKVAGHSDPKTTKRYTHFDISDTQAPLEAICKVEIG